ncbi:hypothetical protein VTN31DRAFT_7440 [Thermomyces dupontii]|uniref:uncharacterized protein n=1 Tax=Talaromyces thermophilus TaxID=28565 RepID=UPI003743471A
MGSIRDHVRYCRLPASRALDSCRRISGSGRHCPESDDEHLLSYYGVAREYLPSEIGPPILIWPRFPAMARDLLVQYGHQSNPQACLVRKVLFLDLDEEVDCTNVSTADKMNYDWAAAQHGRKKKRGLLQSVTGAPIPTAPPGHKSVTHLFYGDGDPAAMHLEYDYPVDRLSVRGHRASTAQSPWTKETSSV